jgi:hypothetical protein
MERTMRGASEVAKLVGEILATVTTPGSSELDPGAKTFAQAPDSTSPLRPFPPAANSITLLG